MAASDPNFALRLSHSLNQRTFTPFIGAGAAALPVASGFPVDEGWNTWPWDALAVQRTLVGQGLTAKELAFLDSFFRARAERFDVPAASLNRTGGQFDPALIQFQQSLLCLAYAMTVRIATPLADSPIVADTFAAVKVAYEPTVTDSVVPALRRVIDAAKLLTQTGAPVSAPDDLVGATGKAVKMPPWPGQVVLRWLVCLANRLLTETVRSDPELNSWYKALTQRYNLDEFETAPEKSALKFGLVEWSLDLLWHSFRFWLPVFPTGSELAFELSLDSRIFEIHRSDLVHGADLAQISEAWDGGTESGRMAMAQQIADRFSYSQAQRRIAAEAASRMGAAKGAEQLTGGFFGAIAAVIAKQGEELRRDSNQGVSSEEEYQRRAAGMVARITPLIFTTNYDQSLERALARLSTNHRVLFPVVQRRPGVVLWCNRRYSFDYDGKHKEEEITPWDRVEIPAECQHEPVIVKLHGSPLEVLPEKRDEKDAFYHYIVLTESSYLDTMLRKAYRLPKWVEDQLSESAGRSLWFFGYSLRDWNVRLRLYDHVWYGEGRGVLGIEKQTRSPENGQDKVATQGRWGNKHTIVPFRDTVQTAFLDGLEVAVYEVKFKAVVPILQRFAKDRL